MRRFPRGRVQGGVHCFLRAADVPKPAAPWPAHPPPLGPSITWHPVGCTGRLYTLLALKNAESRPRCWMPPAEVTAPVASGSLCGGPWGTAERAASRLQLGPLIPPEH